MNVPGIVQSTLDGEDVAARVSLGGEDEVFVTPSRTVVYRADGLLSNESVEEYAHDADRLTISEGRRKARFSLEYALDGTEEFTLPADRVDDVLHPVLAGVLNGNGITDPGESVQRTYRFSELTLIITSHRLVKHVGGPVWDGDYESYHYDDVTKLSFEDGSVATTIVLEIDGRQQRIKAPNEDATEVGERLKRALFSYHDVETLEELNDAVGPEDERDERREDPSAAFGDGIDPLDADTSDADGVERGAVDAADPLADSQSRDPPGTEATASEATTGGGDDGDRSDAAATSVGTGPTAAESTDETPSEPSAPSETDAPTTADGESGTDATEDSPPGLSSNPTTGEPDSTTGEPESSSDESTSSPPEPGGSSDSFEESGFEPATSSTEAELIERLDALESTVEKQTVLLERQQETIETLIEELRQGR